jgi:anti-sigma factor RsiW
MGDCINTEIRDALPDLVHARLDASERARVEAHVAACSECSAEVELLRRAAAVLALGAPRMDARRIAAAVAASPRPSADQPRPIFGRPRLYQLAAAVVLVVLGAGLIRMTLQSGSDVDPRTARGPTAVVTPASGIAMVGGIESLTSDDLATLVAGVESLEAVPATEPEPLQLTSYDLGQGEAQ